MSSQVLSSICQVSSEWLQFFRAVFFELMSLQILMLRNLSFCSWWDYKFKKIFMKMMNAIKKFDEFQWTNSVINLINDFQANMLWSDSDFDIPFSLYSNYTDNHNTTWIDWKPSIKVDQTKFVECCPVHFMWQNSNWNIK